MEPGIGKIGGKDSMSERSSDIHVPPLTYFFAVTTDELSKGYLTLSSRVEVTKSYDWRLRLVRTGYQRLNRSSRTLSWLGTLKLDNGLVAACYTLIRWTP